MQKQIDIMSLGLEELKAWVVEQGEKSYRGLQIFQALHQKFADNPNMESEFEKDIRDVKQLGAFNPLNYDFQNDVPQSYKKRVELEITTGHSRERDEKTLGKEANIDQESTYEFFMDQNDINEVVKALVV